MSFRHTFITEFLYLDNEDREDVKEFISALSHEFLDIQPNWGQYGRLSWIVMYSKDGNGKDEELAMNERCKNLAGILQSTIKIVAAWEGQEDRENVWYIGGRGKLSRLEWMDKADQENQ